MLLGTYHFQLFSTNVKNYSEVMIYRVDINFFYYLLRIRRQSLFILHECVYCVIKNKQDYKAVKV